MSGTVIFSCPRTVGAAPTIPAAATWGRARWGSWAPFLNFALVVSYYSEPNFPGFLTVSELGTEGSHVSGARGHAVISQGELHTSTC